MLGAASPLLDVTSWYAASLRKVTNFCVPCIPYPGILPQVYHWKWIYAYVLALTATFSWILYSVGSSYSIKKLFIKHNFHTQNMGDILLNVFQGRTIRPLVFFYTHRDICRQKETSASRRNIPWILGQVFCVCALRLLRHILVLWTSTYWRNVQSRPANKKYNKQYLFLKHIPQSKGVCASSVILSEEGRAQWNDTKIC
jgi:hypothetical protein